MELRLDNENYQKIQVDSTENLAGGDAAKQFGLDQFAAISIEKPIFICVGFQVIG